MSVLWPNNNYVTMPIHFAIAFTPELGVIWCQPFIWTILLEQLFFFLFVKSLIITIYDKFIYTLSQLYSMYSILVWNTYSIFVWIIIDVLWNYATAMDTDKVSHE